MNSLRFTAKIEDSGKRLDSFLGERLSEHSRTRTYVQKLIEDGGVSVNGAAKPKSYKIKSGDDIEVSLPEAREYEVTAQDIPLDIVYEDGSVIVVNKPRGVVVHPAPGNLDGTLVNALLFHCGDSLSGINGVMRPGIVHRIDKDTSGLLVVAKNDAAHASLARQIEDHSMMREYQTVVHGKVYESGTIDKPIGRDPKNRKKYCVTAVNSKPAVTHYEAVREYERFTHIKCRLETGRTHQIRVHMAYMRHPVAGDLVYGPKNTPKDLNGQCLHAGLLGFVHPETDKYMEFEAGLPEYFEQFLEKI